MSGLFYTLGRSLGYATIPAIRKTKSLWRGWAANEVDAIRAEREFGQAMATELRLKVRSSQQIGIREDVGVILKRLAGRLRNKLRTFELDLIEDDLPTAVALPGGFLFLSTGLVHFCNEDQDQLAFLIGHEMGHVVRGHSLDRVRGQIGSEGLSTLVSRGLLNPDLRKPELNWLQLAYPPEAEFEADEFGIRIAAGGAYDQNGALRFLEKSLSCRQQPEKRSEYLLSHPPELDRIELLRRVTIPGRHFQIPSK